MIAEKGKRKENRKREQPSEGEVRLEIRKGEEKQEGGKDRKMKGWKKVNEEVSKIQVRERRRQRVKKRSKHKKEKRNQNEEKIMGSFTYSHMSVFGSTTTISPSRMHECTELHVEKPIDSTGNIRLCNYLLFTHT